MHRKVFAVKKYGFKILAIVLCYLAFGSTVAYGQKLITPTNGLIAYSALDTGAIRLVDENLNIIVEFPEAWSCDFKFSPNGRYFAYNKNSTLILYDLNNKTEKVLVETSSGGFDWMPDSQSVIYSRGVDYNYESTEYSNIEGLWHIGIFSKKEKEIIPPTLNTEYPPVYP